MKNFVFPMIIIVAIISTTTILPFSRAIDNTQPRRDVYGQLMDVHDGNVIKSKFSIFYNEFEKQVNY